MNSAEGFALQCYSFYFQFQSVASIRMPEVWINNNQKLIFGNLHLLLVVVIVVVVFSFNKRNSKP